MDNHDQLLCPSCGMSMDSGRLILSSRVGVFNFLFGGFMIGRHGTLTWQNKWGNRSEPIAGRNVKIPGHQCRHCGFIAFKMLG